jgi:hypothetical protein
LRRSRRLVSATFVDNSYGLRWHHRANVAGWTPDTTRVRKVHSDSYCFTISLVFITRLVYRSARASPGAADSTRARTSVFARSSLLYSSLRMLFCQPVSRRVLCWRAISRFVICAASSVVTRAPPPLAPAFLPLQPRTRCAVF